MERLRRTDAQIEREMNAIDQRFNETRGDIADLRGEVRALRADMRSDMQGLRTEMRSDMQGLRTEMSAGMQELRAEMITMHRHFDLHPHRLRRRPPRPYRREPALAVNQPAVRRPGGLHDRFGERRVGVHGAGDL
jgi:hypothetical protein